MFPVIALALFGCAPERSANPVPPPASFDPAPPGQLVVTVPPDEFHDAECAMDSVPPPVDEPDADGGPAQSPPKPMEDPVDRSDLTPPPDEEFIDGCVPPDDFGDEADKLEPGRVQLTVSNQSFAEPTVHFVIRIDGDVVTDDDFEVGTQHNWVTFDIDSLAPGEHTITAESDTGATLEETFVLTDTEGAYLLVDYFTDGSGGFNFAELEGPFMSA